MDDRMAFEQAYIAHKDRLLTLSMVLTGDRSAAEDVVHDVFARLIQEPRRLRDESGLPAFLTVCTRNRALDGRRRKGRETVLAGSEAMRHENPDSHNPAEQAARAEEHEILLGMVSTLPDSQREVLTLRMWGELTFEEIAGLQGTTKSTAHARYRQALAELRARLGKGG